VYASHELRISNLTLLGGSIRVQIRSTPTLMATAAGTSRSHVSYSAPSLNVQGPGGTEATLNAVNPIATFVVPGTGRVTLTAGVLHEDVVTPLRIKVSASLLGVTITEQDGSRTDLTVGTQSLLATAPSRGVSCTNGLPALATSAEPITVQPVLSGDNGTGSAARAGSGDANGSSGGGGGGGTTDTGITGRSSAAGAGGRNDPTHSAGVISPTRMLPSTGVNGVGPLTSGGAGLLVAGFGLLLLAGRRRAPRPAVARRRHARPGVVTDRTDGP
jgi:hypothetical protein